MKEIQKFDDNILKKIIKYYNLSVIDNNFDRDNLIKIINNNLYLDKDNVLRKKDYENRYILLKEMIISGNDNPDLQNELQLF